jgi:predicted nucleic acid binding AN1-type Zn finger protein
MLASDDNKQMGLMGSLSCSNMLSSHHYPQQRSTRFSTLYHAFLMFV